MKKSLGFIVPSPKIAAYDKQSIARKQKTI